MRGCPMTDEQAAEDLRATLLDEADGVIDWAAWALEMCSLLDRVEAVADDAAAVHVLVRGRFKMAERHGVEVEFLGPTSGALQ